MKNNNSKVFKFIEWNVENLNQYDPHFRFQGIAKLIAESDVALAVLPEIQDNDGPKDTGVVDASKTAGRLIKEIKKLGGKEYKYIDIPPMDKEDGGQPGGNIRVGFLYDPNVLRIYSLVTAGDATTPVEISDGHLTLNPGRIYPEDECFYKARKPLVCEFDYDGHQMFVVGLHLSSKRRREADIQRVRQAQVVGDFSKEVIEKCPKATIIVAGDINDGPASEAGRILGDVLENLLYYVPQDSRYTHIYHGHRNLLDHVYMNDLEHGLRVKEVEIKHLKNKRNGRISDHDAVLVTLGTGEKAPKPLGETPVFTKTSKEEIAIEKAISRHKRKKKKRNKKKKSNSFTTSLARKEFDKMTLDEITEVAKIEASKWGSQVRGDFGEIALRAWVKANFPEAREFIAEKYTYDGVFEIDDEFIIIGEAKCNLHGEPHLRLTKTMGRQLSEQWITGMLTRNVNSRNPKVKETGLRVKRAIEDGKVKTLLFGINCQGEIYTEWNPSGWGA